MRKGVASLWLLVAIVGVALGHQTDAQVVQSLLSRWHTTSMIQEEDLARIKSMPGHGLALLASYLNDKDLGFLAESAMTEIDSMGAAPYLIENLPNRDPNVQREAFRSANLLIWQYQLSRISGPEKPDPTKAPPRWPMNTKPYPYMRQLHEAAIKAARAETPIAGSEIVRSIALTGTRRDIPLIDRIAKQDPLLADACVAAKARLGDRRALDAIQAALDEPVKAVPAGPYYTDSGQKIDPPPGAVVCDEADGKRMRTACRQAAFTLNRRFVAALLKHVQDPPGQGHGDYADPSPGDLARDTLSTILLGKEYSAYSAEQWLKWPHLPKRG